MTMNGVQSVGLTHEGLVSEVCESGLFSEYGFNA
jgi:hypothetical protein